jgi:hypothetical protein
MPEAMCLQLHRRRDIKLLDLAKGRFPANDPSPKRAAPSPSASRAKTKLNCHTPLQINV